MKTKYVVYYRVSTKKQGESKLGLEAQQSKVQAFLTSHECEEVPPSFTEIESGKNPNRKELRKAIDRCKETHSTLLIAKLDRLSRNVAFFFTLKEELQKGGVDFLALDLPEANTLMLGVMISMAQHEAELISSRTKSALRELQDKGVKLGNPNWEKYLTDEVRDKARKAISTSAKEDPIVLHCYNYIKVLRESGLTYEKIAERLNKDGFKSRKNKPFHSMQVQRIFNRFKNE